MNDAIRSRLLKQLKEAERGVVSCATVVFDSLGSPMDTEGVVADALATLVPSLKRLGLARALVLAQGWAITPLIQPIRRA